MKIDEDRANAGASSAVDVAPAIADQPGAREVEIEGGGGIEDHTGLGLASAGRFAAAWIVADLDTFNLGDEGAQAIMHGIDDELRLRAATDVRLVGDDHQGVAGLIERTAGGGDIGEELELVD